VRLPRDISGTEFIRRLKKLNYIPTRQTGSHVRLTYASIPQHHITVPLHDSLRVGTLSAIIGDIAVHQNVDKAKIIERLFG
jgi:predicted RNA binding protein YcfA (HicA-like mRNA interferase family)